jgi:Tol biopolymer transport system component
MRRHTTLGLLGALVTLLASAAGATASSTSDKIAFSRQITTGGANVFVADADGAHAQQVPLAYPAEDFGVPFWSPDRSRLLISHVLRFNAAGDLLPFRPATVNLDGSSFNLLEPPGAGFDGGCLGGWYPDGNRLLCAFDYGPPTGVFSIRASDGGDPIRLTSYPYGQCNACDQPADTSPDGKRFVFMRFKNEETRNQQVALFVENTDGTRLRQITPYGFAQPHEIAAAHWSPDGRRIISETTQGRLFVVRPDGAGVSLIRLQVGTSRYFAFEPDWSPDGSRIVFAMWKDGQEDLYTARADGSDVVQITDTPDVENGPDWGRSSGTP